MARNELLTKFQSLKSSTEKWELDKKVKIISFPVAIILFPVYLKNTIITISLVRNDLLTKFQSLESSSEN